MQVAGFLAAVDVPVHALGIDVVGQPENDAVSIHEVVLQGRGDLPLVGGAFEVHRLGAAAR